MTFNHIKSSKAFDPKKGFEIIDEDLSWLSTNDGSSFGKNFQEDD